MNKNLLLLQGGLGNQLFELFFSTAHTLSSNKANALTVVTSLLGKYKTPREVEIMPLLNNDLLDYKIQDSCFAVRARFAKIITKITGYEFPVKIPFYGNIFDGYFQDINQYMSLNQDVMARVIMTWRKKLLARKITSQTFKNSISHIRLSDMFTSQENAYKYLHKRVLSLPDYAEIITDDEPLVNNFLQEFQGDRGFSLLSTTGFGAWEVLDLMTRYQSIYTNGSTLAFWACILSGGKLESSNLQHNALCEYLNGITAKHLS